MTKFLGDILIKVVFSLIEAFANKLIIKGCELDMSSGLCYKIIVVHRTMTMGIFRAQIYCITKQSSRSRSQISLCPPDLTQLVHTRAVLARMRSADRRY